MKRTLSSAPPRLRTDRPEIHLTTEQPPLLVERAEACRMLGGISTATAIRLEAAGKLTPRKLFGAPLGKTFYAHKEVVALAKGGDDAK